VNLLLLVQRKSKERHLIGDHQLTFVNTVVCRAKTGVYCLSRSLIFRALTFHVYFGGMVFLVQMLRHFKVFYTRLLLIRRNIHREDRHFVPHFTELNKHVR